MVGELHLQMSPFAQELRFSKTPGRAMHRFPHLTS